MKKIQQSRSYTYNKIGEDLSIPHSGTEEWAEKAVLFLDGKELSKEQYSFSGSTLKLDKSLLTESKEYTISAKAEGFADSTPVKFKMYPANGDRICNGNISYGDTAWKYYIHNGNCAVLEYDNGHLDVHYDHAEADQWGIIPWAIQWNQTVPVDTAGDYVISFAAYSQVERQIMVTVAGNIYKVDLTKEPQIHEINVNIPSAGSYEIQFQMGATNPDTENGYFMDIAGFVDFGAHDLYLDGFSMLPASASSNPGTGSSEGSGTIIDPIVYSQSAEDDILEILNIQLDKEYLSQLLEEVFEKSGETAKENTLYTFKAESETIDADQEQPETIVNDMELAQEKAAEQKLTIAAYMDIDLNAYINKVKAAEIHELEEEAVLTIEIPSELRKTNRVFSMIRVHEGEPVVLADQNLDSDPNTIEIKTDRFSTYVLVYKDRAVMQPVAGNNDGDSSNGRKNSSKNNSSNTDSIQGISREDNIGIGEVLTEDKDLFVSITDRVKTNPDTKEESAGVEADESIMEVNNPSTEENVVADEAAEETEDSILLTDSADNNLDASAKSTSNVWRMVLIAILAAAAISMVAVVGRETKKHEKIR